MGSVNVVGLVQHPQRDCAEVVGVITKWAAERGTEVVELGAKTPEAAVAEQARRADLLVSLGGDGTMLRALRIAHEQRTPVLGVNIGRLGFLPEVDTPELAEALCAIDEGRFTIETRSGLCITSAGHSVVAFNDIALLRTPGHGMAAIEVHIEGQPFVSYAADALVVATPTGSTAYSFSAGGPIVSPRVEGLLITPVAPHSAFNRALFLSQREQLALRILPSSGELGVEVDGRLVARPDPGTLIDITVQPTAARVVRLGHTTFYQRAQRKLRLIGSPIA